MIGIGCSDLFSFGRKYISNPNLVYRQKNDLTLTQGDSRYYGEEIKGCTDYSDY